MIIVVDWTKLVDRLRDVVVPIEVIPFGIQHTMKRLQSVGTLPALREVNGGKFVSDNGNFIVDCRIECLDDAKNWHTRLVQIPGVVETGIFSDLVNLRIVGYGNQRIELRDNDSIV